MNISVLLTGVSSTVVVGELFFWRPIAPDAINTWTEVSGSDTNWTEIAA